MRSRRAVVVGGLLASAWASGCLGSVPFRPRAYDEAVRVVGFQVDFQPDGTGVLDLDLEVKNPASDAATLAAVDFTLRVDGRRVAVGTQQVAAPLAEEGSAPLRVLFPLASGRASGGLEPVRRRVQVEGGVVLRFGGTERRAPFQAERVMPLAWAPPLEGE